MDFSDTRQVGRELDRYLAEFSDCFGRRDAEPFLEVYVASQKSDLQRRSAEPIVIRTGIVPYSLQVFLALANWNERRMIDYVQEIVARYHSRPYAFGPGETRSATPLVMRRPLCAVR
jgi:hypothetical protein